jgi:TRAP-type C4-dicarboxylate transport system permease small subunit
MKRITLNNGSFPINIIPLIGSKIHQGLIGVAGIFLLAMVTLTCANICSRLIWMPIRGTFELMGFFGATTTAFALGYTQMKKGHISVDVLINTFSPKTRRILDSINNSIGLLFFSFLGWRIAEKAVVLKKTQEVSETLRFPYYPFTMGVAFGCVVLAGVMLRDLIIGLSKEDYR